MYRTMALATSDTNNRHRDTIIFSRCAELNQSFLHDKSNPSFCSFLWLTLRHKEGTISKNNSTTTNYTSPSVGVRSIVISKSVYLSVCRFLYARISQKPTSPNFTNFRHTLPVAVARSFSDSNGIRYVLPVLWITSRFHIVNQSINQLSKE